MQPVACEDRSWKWLLALLAAQLGAAWYLWNHDPEGSIFDRLTSWEPEVLEIDRPSLDVGELAAGMWHETSATIRNPSLFRTLTLERPSVSCGCLSARVERQVLRPGEETRLRIEIRSPLRPGPFQEQIALRVRGRKAAIGTVSVQGEAIADVWADPPVASIVLDAPSGPSTELRLHAERPLDGAQLTFLTDAPAIQVQATNGSENTVQLAVSVQSQERGFGTIRVFASDRKQPLAMIPVEWDFEPTLDVRPAQLVVESRRQARSEPQSTSVIVVTHPPGPVPHVRPLVAGVAVMEIQSLREGTYEVHLRLQPEKFPPAFRGEILEIASSNNPYRCRVEARAE